MRVLQLLLVTGSGCDAILGQIRLTEDIVTDDLNNDLSCYGSQQAVDVHLEDSLNNLSTRYHSVI